MRRRMKVSWRNGALARVLRKGGTCVKGEGIFSIMKVGISNVAKSFGFQEALPLFPSRIPMCSAFCGQARTQSPQRIHSMLLGFLLGSIFILQAFAQALQ